MFEDPPIRAALRRAARRNNADAEALCVALQHESADELALALDIPIANARERMGRVQRVLAFTGDWGAGCRLLTDDLRDELVGLFEAW